MGSKTLHKSHMTDDEEHMQHSHPSWRCRTYDQKNRLGLFHQHALLIQCSDQRTLGFPRFLYCLLADICPYSLPSFLRSCRLVSPGLSRSLTVNTPKCSRLGHRCIHHVFRSLYLLSTWHSGGCLTGNSHPSS